MKHMKLNFSSVEKSNKIFKIFNKYDAKFVNDFYVIDDKQYKKFKNEIESLDFDMSINKNPDYVIIKEKMNRVPPPKYVTYDVFNKFVGKVDSFVDEQRAFNKKVENYIDKQNTFNVEVQTFNAKVEKFIEKQNVFNTKVEDYMVKHS